MRKSRLVNVLFSIFALSNISSAMDDGFQTINNPSSALQRLLRIPENAPNLKVEQRIFNQNNTRNITLRANWGEESNRDITYGMKKITWQLDKYHKALNKRKQELSSKE